jgi:hypothetical protein
MSVAIDELLGMKADMIDEGALTGRFGQMAHKEACRYNRHGVSR